MDDFFTLLKVSLVFAAVVYAMRKRAPMGISLAGGGVVVALLMGQGPGWIAREIAGGRGAILFTYPTLEFAGVLGIVAMIAYLMERSGQVARLTNAFSGLVGSTKVRIAALPAVFGLLPMPAGVLFSAPMVESVAEGTPLAAEDKALINYWYRHVWEYAWPLYNGMLVASQLLHEKVATITRDTVSLAQGPLCLVAMAAGTMYLGKVTAGSTPKRKATFRDVAVLVFSLAPVVTIVVLNLACGVELLPSAALSLAMTSLGMLAARTTGIVTVLKVVFANRGVYAMMMMAFGAKIFGGLMVASGAIPGIARLLQSLNLPIELLAIVLPLTVGFFSGFSLISVMTVFPILLSFPAVVASPIPITTLAFASGNAGMFLSPVHSCMFATSSYFKVDLLRLMKRIAPPAFIVITAGFALMLLYRRIY